jgi:hypothetical protein
MKRCPSCERSYPDSENFCEADRSALIADDPPFTKAGSVTPAECPMCGGKTQPGEIICNFCGARLTDDAVASPATAPKSSTTARPSAPLSQGGSVRLTSQMPSGSNGEGGRSFLTIAGYVVAAVVALSAGAWLAVHMSGSKTAPEAVASASVEATPEAASSAAAGASMAASPEASPSAAEAAASPAPIAPSPGSEPSPASANAESSPSAGAGGAATGGGVAAAIAAAAGGAAASAPSVAAEAPASESSVAAAPPPVRRHRATPKPVPTPSLQQMVKDAMRANAKLKRVDCFTSPGGAVTIFGKVFDDKDRALAGEVARNVAGVTSVNNSVSTDAADWMITQNQITSQLAIAGLTGVTVKVIAQDAYLSGTVNSELDKQRAVTITQSAAAVKVKGNIITVAAGRVFGF